MSTLELLAYDLPIDVAGLQKTFGKKVALADFALQLRHHKCARRGETNRLRPDSRG